MYVYGSQGLAVPVSSSWPLHLLGTIELQGRAGKLWSILRLLNWRNLGSQICSDCKAWGWGCAEGAMGIIACLVLQRLKGVETEV